MAEATATIETPTTTAAPLFQIEVSAAGSVQTSISSAARLPKRLEKLHNNLTSEHLGGILRFQMDETVYETDTNGDPVVTIRTYDDPLAPQATVTVTITRVANPGSVAREMRLILNGQTVIEPEYTGTVEQFIRNAAAQAWTCDPQAVHIHHRPSNETRAIDTRVILSCADGNPLRYHCYAELLILPSDKMQDLMNLGEPPF